MAWMSRDFECKHSLVVWSNCRVVMELHILADGNICQCNLSFVVVLFFFCFFFKAFFLMDIFKQNIHNEVLFAIRHGLALPIVF